MHKVNLDPVDEISLLQARALVTGEARTRDRKAPEISQAGSLKSRFSYRVDHHNRGCRVYCEPTDIATTITTTITITIANTITTTTDIATTITTSISNIITTTTTITITTTITTTRILQQPPLLFPSSNQ
ncbi:hypothetical protein PoB_003550300 [Plakobranchus ocellatus]|uniref:Uncharacterized protein n=1 Tax=Plakobranchus ocellatus TaxID=259542 RepID=A0AAV4AR06_9GAST|nr:hypothetical protein PoB_003550300 [Plakobranchus ocellatus]